MRHWLFKSEPSVFSIDDLKQRPKQTDYWNGVRNYQVRNFLRDEMKVGDLAFFYHSNCNPPGIVGVMEVVKTAYPDLTAWDPKSPYYDPTSSPDKPRWFMVDVKFIKKFKEIISLDQIKSHPDLKNMAVAQRGNRLSVTPVSGKEWEIILKIAK